LIALGTGRDLVKYLLSSWHPPHIFVVPFIDAGNYRHYIKGMDFEWDEQKAASNFAKHRLTFRDAVAVFDDPAHLIIDTTRDTDGEPRSKAVGWFKGKLYTIVFSMRGSRCRIISARRANTREEKIYGDR
jgi:uncharacterized DUF497 family protein